MSLQSSTAYRFAVGLALTAAFLIVWLNAAAGLIGIEDDDPANLLYVGVLAIGFIGAIIARLQFVDWHARCSRRHWPRRWLA